VYTPDGWAVVIHDELEGFMEDIERTCQTEEEIAKLACYRMGVTIRLEERTSEHEPGDEVVWDRDYLLLEKEHNTVTGWV
jgi:hypothetical protein